ncbi:MAG: hypothetical protein KJZ83_00185 [Burkholderiaceae bacterium]|nr:hypothetical protein [Burkholderiaceae bacterium]
MSSAASLSLLKGGKTAALEEELEKKPDAAEVAEQPAAEKDDGEAVVVDVDKMSSKELDALVAEHEIEVPEGWAKMKVDEKRAWLNEQFAEADDGETEQAPEQAEEAASDTTAAEPEPAPEMKAPEQAGKALVSKAEKPAKSKKPGKAVAKTGKTAKTGTIETPGDDVLSDLVHEIENMKENEARAVVTALNNETEMTLFKLGGVLSVIQANGWYEPYASFREYVEKELGMHYRRAAYWVSIYNHLAESKVPWEKVKDLGWTKLKEIAEVLTIENVDEWVSLANSQTTLQLIETVKGHKAKDAPKALEDQSAKTVTTKTFKVHEDQKATIEAAIAKAKEQSGTSVDTAALEFVCLDFLGGQTMTQRLQKMGLEAALEALEKAFPTTNISVEIEESDE